MADDPPDQRQQKEPQPAPHQMVLGLIAGPGISEEIGQEIAQRLPAVLQQRFPAFAWRVVIRIEQFAGAGADVDLFQLARLRMLESGWQLAVCLTDRPLKVGWRPVTAQASAALGVGVVSVPALGALGLRRLTLVAVLSTIDALLRDQQHRLEDLSKLSSPIGQAFEAEAGTVAFATATAGGNFRLLLGIIRGNRPWAVILGLSHALVAALGTSAFGLTSPVIWRIANAMPWQQTILLNLIAVFAMGFTMIAAHGLWEWTTRPRARTKVVLINMATAATVAIGIITLYLALLVLNFLFGRSLIIRPVLQNELQYQFDGIKHVGLVHYVRIAWVVSSLATLGGALGTVLESSEIVRAAAFCIRPTERRRRRAEPFLRS